jgi:hypothetical protein
MWTVEISLQTHGGIMRTLVEIFYGFFEGKYNLKIESRPPTREVKNLRILIGYLACIYLLPTFCRILFF